MTSMTYRERMSLAELANAALVAAAAVEQRLVVECVTAANADSPMRGWLDEAGGHAGADADPIIQALRLAGRQLEAARTAIMSIDPESLAR